MIFMRGRRPIIMRASALLLLGAIVNVAVAWGLCMRSTFHAVSVRNGSWPAAKEVWSRFMGKPCDGYAWYGFANSSLGSRAAIVNGECLCDRTLSSVAYLKVGWPAYSLEGQRWLHQPPVAALPTWTNVAMIDVTNSFLQQMFNEQYAYWPSRELPIQAIWPGFAINTIFYTAVLWLLIFAPGKVRLLIRIRRGRCPACGYQIAPGTCSGGVCSECGQALPARWSESR
jgi:hypothetical protein